MSLHINPDVLTAQRHSCRVCPFCEGEGKISVGKEELSLSWSREVRERVLHEISEMKITQDLFACASLACRQSHLSKILNQASVAPVKDRRLEELRQIVVFLNLPLRCRQDIYERVASDPDAFVRAARLHAKLLEEDLGVPGISQISRAVLDRFASEITLYPDPHEVAALSETLNLHPVLVQSYFNKMALNLTSAPPSACETAADFKVPGTSKRPHPKNSRPPTSAKRPRIWVASATTVVLPESSLNVSAAARKTPSPSPAVVSATDESQSFTSTPVAVLKSRENEAIPVPSVKKDAKMGQQPHQLPEDIWVWPAMNSSPLKRDEEAAGVETEDSFVRGLLASPPSGHGGSPLPQAEVFEDRFPSALNTPGPPDEEECGF